MIDVNRDCFAAGTEIAFLWASAPGPSERQTAEMSAIQATESLLALSEQEELEDLPKDYSLSTSEDEGDSDGNQSIKSFWKQSVPLMERRGNIPIKLDRRKLAERSEASLKMSKFTVNSEGSGEKLVFSDLLESVKTSSLLATVKKQLNRVKSKKTVEFTEKWHSIKTSPALSKWDPIVLKNRQAEQLVFPLKKEQSTFAPIEHVLSGWKARTPLEQEIFNLLHRNKYTVTDPLLTPMEKASLKAMSLKEAKIRHQELQRARALQSYYEARARREKKIKNQKYHKVLRKGKATKALKEFEKLQKVSPLAALEELEKLEKAKMMEQMSLKHQNSGKWAKSKAIMAKYDLEARQAMQEQLVRNKELTQKLQVASKSEEEDGGTEEEGDLLVPDAVNETQMTAGEPYPWMIRNHSIDTKKSKMQRDPEQLPEPIANEASENEGEEKPVAEEEILLKEFEERQSLRKMSGLNQDIELVGRQERKDSSSQEVLSELRALSQNPNKENHQSRKQNEDEQEQDQRQMIKEAFAVDDVIRDFLKEKREAVESTPEGPPRKDKNLPNVIINEKQNIRAAAHQVRVLPYPFTHHQQSERTIQVPIGSTWNTQRAFQKLTMPKVVTKPGHIIKPIKAEDVGYQSSSRSDLSVIQKNPKQLSICHKKTAEQKF